VLTLAREATDLDRLVDQEAATIRADAHRDLLAELERRSQQVWVPVTVATLLPGSLLLLVPFLDALRLFAGA
jgi:tight adherence protein C